MHTQIFNLSAGICYKIHNTQGSSQLNQIWHQIAEIFLFYESNGNQLINKKKSGLENKIHLKYCQLSID